MPNEIPSARNKYPNNGFMLNYCLVN
jgi:hypothetical protein